MDANKVVEILSAMGVRAVANGYGLEIRTAAYGYDLHKPMRWERGSGIAGRVNIWHFREIASGERIGEPCRTEAQLRKVMREWLAGEKPGFPGNWYAKRNRNRFSNDYIWVQR